MPRPRKDDAPDLSKPCELSVGAIERLVCPAGKTQAFLRDTKAPGLRVRVTTAGAKSYVFEAKLDRKTIRRTIGDVRSWTLDDARVEARRLRVAVDQGDDPRQLEREREAAAAKAKEQAALADAAEVRRGVTVAEIWPDYMAHGKPRGKEAWKPRYRSDLERAAALGGEPRKRGGGITKPGHLAPLMPMRLADIDSDTVRDWYASERKRAPVQAGRAVAMFSGFLSWCATRKEYRDLVTRDAARASELGDVLPQKRRRVDALELDQLKPWFAGTAKLRSAPARAYLQGLVLTGARREELAGLRWADVDFQWRKLTIADKVDATRVIPLTPYLSQLLASLPRTNAYVFASALSKSGRIAEPRAPHADVLADAGIPHVTIHGLRRTFSLMGEAAGAPAGAIAQVMGHKPSAVAEGYRPRSVDALRPYLEQIERFILDRAGIDFGPANAARLRLVDTA